MTLTGERNGAGGSRHEGAPVAAFDKQPPQDLPAEQSVLGGMMLSKDAIADVVDRLTSVDFYRPAHQAVYECVLDLYGRGEPADAVTVASELERRGELGRVGGAPYLHTLIETVPTAANAGYYAQIVADKAVLRRLVEAGTRIAQLGYAGGDGDEVDEVVDRAQAAVYDATSRRMTEDYVVLEELLQPTMDEIDAIASRGGSGQGVPTGFLDLDDVTNGLHPAQMVIVAARPGVGKALALDTPLPTPDGWTSMGEVQVGDRLLAADGTPTTVTDATEVMVGRPCYEVELSDGTVVVADAKHQWVTTTRASRRQHAERKNTPRWPESVMSRVRRSCTTPDVGNDELITFNDTLALVGDPLVTTEQLAGTLRCADGRFNHAVGNAAPLQLAEQDLLISPYTFGAWLGDGHSRAARITSTDAQVVQEIRDEGYRVDERGSMLYSIKLPVANPVERPCMVRGAPFVPKTSQVRTCGRRCGPHARHLPGAWEPSCPDCGGPSSELRRCESCHRRHGSMQARLRTLGVLGEKHIPTGYLRASERQRRALLAGLLDTHGTLTAGGSVQFAVTDERLARGAYELVVSLGYRCSFTTRRVPGRTVATSTCFVLTFSTPDVVFRLARKRRLHEQRRAGESTSRSDVRYVVNVRRVEAVPVRCVQVDNTARMYLASRAMVPTHNSTLGLDIARSCSVRHGMTSLIFSLEMSRSEIVMRMLSAEARIRLGDMRGGRMSEDDWTRLARRISEIAAAPLYIDDSPNMTMMEIRAKARRLRQRHDLRLIVVDYMQLMTSGKRVESRQQEVSEFSRQLKLLAKELEVPVVAISQLNRGPEQRTDKRPMLADLRESGCVTADTRILRADTGAEMTIGELLRSGERPLVWSLDERLRLVPRPMTNVFPTGTKEVFRLRLTSGRQIDATANHPMLALGGWVPLGELAPGDRIAVPREVPEPLSPASMPEAEIILLAHLIGDGSFVRRQPIRYASVHEANLVAVSEAARHFGVTPVRDEHPGARCTALRLPAPHHLTHGRRNPIAAWLDDLGLFGLRSHEKFIPTCVFSLPKEQVALFLRHLWATDGSVRWDATVGLGRVYYASTSRALVDGIAQLLRRFGLFVRVKEARKPGYRTCWHLYLYGAENQLRFLDQVGVHGARAESARRVATALRGIASNTNVDTVPREVWTRVRQLLADNRMTHREFAAAMGTKFCGSTVWKHAPSRSRLARAAAVLEAADLDMVATNHVFWDEIAEITPLGEQEVYDATVPGTHNFTANGISIHNSLEQDADIVLLINRPDAWERDDPRAGEADLILAKHRSGPTNTITVAHQLHYSRFVDLAQG